MNDALTMLESLVAIAERIESKLASNAAVSSVEIKTSARGTDVTTKAYAGSDIRPAGDQAIDEYIRVVREVERRLMGPV